MVKVQVKYSLGHTIVELFTKSPMFCPQCGRKTVWVEQGDGDYYVGPNHVCQECGINFTAQVGLDSKGTPEDQQRANQLKQHSITTTAKEPL